MNIGITALAYHLWDCNNPTFQLPLTIKFNISIYKYTTDKIQKTVFFLCEVLFYFISSVKLLFIGAAF